MKARILVPGRASGSLLRLEEPVSFWGGIDPRNARVIATGHPQHGVVISGRVLALERSVGSSSGSSILLELLARKIGPAGIILAEPDQILTLGAVVAREMSYAQIPVVQLPLARFDSLPKRLSIDIEGGIACTPEVP